MSVESIIRQRRSCRAYKSDTVPRALIERVLEAGRLAPSACNKQPWRFAVVTDAARRRQIVDTGFRKGISMPWAATAPVLIVIGMKRSALTHRLFTWISKVDYPWIDIGIAGEHLVLQAEELGLATCWIGWINPRRVRRIVGWTPDIHAAEVLTLGYAADSDTPPKRTSRRALESITNWL